MVKRVSLKDIAREVGVSSALVSYVLNEKKTGRISKAITQKIKDKAQELNYRTNQIARSLKTSRTNTIGFMVSNISNPFSSYLARVIEYKATRNNFTVLVGSSDENIMRFEKLVDTFLTRQVDGLIIAPGEHTASQIRYLQQQEIPFVLVDRYFPDLNTNYVVLDNFAAGYEATKHFIKNGYQRIGMINYRSSLHNLNERTKGYFSAIDDASGELVKKVDNNNLQEEVEQAINELLALDKPTDALLFASNEITLYALIHLNKLKINVPRDLAIITFDELITWNIFYAPVTYIQQPLQRMAEMATKILLENIEEQQPVQQVSLPGTLIVQASSQPK